MDELSISNILTGENYLNIKIGGGEEIALVFGK
jgi:hypothetical protein